MHSSRMHTAAAVAVCWGGVYLSACEDIPPLGVGLETPLGVGQEIPPGVGLETPPGQTLQLLPWVWAWRLPRPDPSTSPPRVWAWRPPQARPSTSPWVWAWRPARHARIPPPSPVNRMTDRHKQK